MYGDIKTAKDRLGKNTLKGKPDHSWKAWKGKKAVHKALEKAKMDSNKKV